MRLFSLQPLLSMLKLKLNGILTRLRVVEKWQKAMTEAYELGGKKSRQTGTRAKHYYDRLVCSLVLQPGDRVLVCNLSEHGGPGKLQSHWEDRVHIVVSRKDDDSPVYEVKPGAGTGA